MSPCQSLRQFMILQLKQANRSSGFILAELVVVIIIIAVVFAGGVASLNQFQGKNAKGSYNQDLENIQVFIGKARAYAKANRLGDNWGIKILMSSSTGCGTTSTVNCFVLFKGNDYGTRDSTYDEFLIFNSNLIRYDGTNNEREIYFQKVTGWGRGFDNATNTDDTGFRLRNSDGSYDCIVKIGILGVVYNNCES